MEYDQQGNPVPQKKKRAYAAQAYEFGGNAGQPGQQPAGVPPQAYGGYGQPMATPPMGAPQMGAPQMGAPQMGGVPPMGAVPQVAGSPDLASQFGHMNIHSQPPAAPAMQAPQHLNQLFPSDLMSQPFQVSELDLPPPLINLPLNTSVTPSPYANCPPKYVRSTLNTVPTTHSLLKRSRLPFALVISPYTSLHDNEDPVSSALIPYHAGP